MSQKNIGSFGFCKKAGVFWGAQRNPKIPQIPTSPSSHSTSERTVLLWGSCSFWGVHQFDATKIKKHEINKKSEIRCENWTSPRNLQQDRSWTDPEKTWVSNSSIATSWTGSVGIRSHSIFWWNFSKHDVHPWNLTLNLKRSPWKRRFLLETIIFRFHVEFRGCTSKPISEWGGLHVTARSWYLVFLRTAGIDTSSSGPAQVTGMPQQS